MNQHEHQIISHRENVLTESICSSLREFGLVINNLSLELCSDVEKLTALNQHLKSAIKLMELEGQ